MSTKRQMHTDEIQEVGEFLRVWQRVQDFVDRHREILRELHALGLEYNESLEAADKAVRNLSVSCGPFQQAGCSYDAGLLLKELGQEAFMKIGGTVSQKTVASIEKRDVEKAVGMKQISQDLFDLAQKPRYRRLRKFEMP